MNCNHFWLGIAGTNDYECRSCGSRKGDTGSIYPCPCWTVTHEADAESKTG